MAEIVRMPKLSDTMTEGVVAEWHKKIGDNVETGDLLAEIETDKATLEFESFQDGILLYIGVEKSKPAPVDSILAILGKKGEDITSILDEELKKEAALEEKDEVVAKSIEEVEINEESSKQEAVIPSSGFPRANSVLSSNIKISPLAKKLAKDRGVNLRFVVGTGEDGRIIKRDIDNYQGKNQIASSMESFSEEPVSQMRKVIAQRLSESKFSAPHFYLSISIDMDNIISSRKSINKSISPLKVSINDFVVKAVSGALREHPKVNSSWLGNVIRYNEHINIGVAVAVDEGLLVPVVRFADLKTLTQIGSEVKGFSQKAKDKKLEPKDWEGNTFTISNLGMFGIDEFTAIINPPDACIMAVGGISQVPVVKDGVIVPGNIMKVTLSCDHRVVDGVVGSQFLATFKKYMENPVLLLGKDAI
jgi:pyruvate dehydrogenase E2 component (dihydrolipoamide acetyltransferase)